MNDKEVLEQIQSRFTELYRNDRTIQGLENQLLRGSISNAEVHDYSRAIGETLRKAWAENVYTEVLDNGILYEEQALTLLNPTVRHNYDLISSYYARTRTAMNENLGLGLKPIIPKYSTEKTQGLAAYISGLPYQEREVMFLDSLITNAMIVSDVAIYANVKFLRESGIKVKVRRRLAGRTKSKDGSEIPCKLCQQFNGEEYNFGETPDYFWSRHQGCRCIFDELIDGKVVKTK